MSLSLIVFVHCLETEQIKLANAVSQAHQRNAGGIKMSETIAYLILRGQRKRKEMYSVHVTATIIEVEYRQESVSCGGIPPLA